MAEDQYTKEQLIAMLKVAQARSEAKENVAISLLQSLRELVELKEIKDTKGKTQEYLQRQPLAWSTAKRLVTQHKYLGVKG